ncbi:formylglycine-generating enzyme family protein [Paraburkholderia xenovorans]
MSSFHKRPGCCVPREKGLPVLAGVERKKQDWANTGSHHIEQALIPRGSFLMGDRHRDGYFSDGESPTHIVDLAAFSIDATTVTVADFDNFVTATGYVTDAERHGHSAVFHMTLRAEADDIVGVPPQAPWWRYVRAANWLYPYGRYTDPLAIRDHPVTHVSWNDAIAYCEWADRRLPTEAEWEYASRGGLAHGRFPWGDTLCPQGEWLCNVWQGEFPDRNMRTDGYLATVPVRSYRPNGYGLWQTVGNVWEWCADWFSRSYYSVSPACNPTGPLSGKAKVIRGGSYLCHESYCYRYRNSARSSNTIDSSTSHLGFRTVGIS